MRGGLGASVVISCLYSVIFVCSNCYMCVFWRIVSLCVLSGGDKACDEAAENLSVECGNSECSKKSSKRHSPLSDKLDELDRTE